MTQHPQQSAFDEAGHLLNRVSDIVRQQLVETDNPTLKYLDWAITEDRHTLKRVAKVIDTRPLQGTLL